VAVSVTVVAFVRVSYRSNLTRKQNNKLSENITHKRNWS